MGNRGPTGTKTNTLRVDAGTSARTLSKPPVPTDAGYGRGHKPRLATAFLIHLDLKELIELDTSGVGQIKIAGSLATKSVMAKGATINKDPKRPAAVLAIVQKKFAKLNPALRVELGAATGADRFLKVHFGWPIIVGGKPKVHKRHGPLYDPDFVGAGAKGLSRKRVETFTPLKGDPKSGVTAYVFEGAIGNVITNFFPGKSVSVNNIFATAIVHELGHNLGLRHGISPKDIMFVYAGRSEAEQKQWMTLAEQGKLGFNSTQIMAIRRLLRS